VEQVRLQVLLAVHCFMQAAAVAVVTHHLRRQVVQV
jgi:hypothetical protein